MIAPNHDMRLIKRYEEIQVSVHTIQPLSKKNRSKIKFVTTTNVIHEFSNI